MKNSNWLLFIDLDFKPFPINSFADRMSYTFYFGELVSLEVYETQKGFHVFVELKPFEEFKEDETLKYMIEAFLGSDASVVVWRYLRAFYGEIQDTKITGNIHIKKRGDKISKIYAKRNKTLESALLLTIAAKQGLKIE